MLVILVVIIIIVCDMVLVALGTPELLLFSAIHFNKKAWMISLSLECREVLFLSEKRHNVGGSDSR